MASLLENLQLGCAVCRIAVYSICRRICCGAPAAPRPEYSLVCIGLGGVGKSTLLHKLCGESTGDIEPTKGFTIKAVQCPKCILNIKEIGGGEKIRPFWKHYYSGSEGIIFVVDSTCTADEMETNKQELQAALSNPHLGGLPCLVLASCQDKPGARTQQQVEQELDLAALCQGRDWDIQACSAKDIPAVKEGLAKLAEHLLPSPGPQQNTGTANKI